MRWNEITESMDFSYYMEEGCGIFALALSNVIPGGQIGILSRNYGEEWSRSIPYEVTHVFYSIDGKTYDCKGERSLESMASDFGMVGNFSIKGGWTPTEFKKKFIGSSDTKPLYGNNRDVQEAMKLIESKPELFGLSS